MRCPSGIDLPIVIKDKYIPILDDHD